MVALDRGTIFLVRMDGFLFLRRELGMVVSTTLRVGYKSQTSLPRSGG
jgi:hypothetical protein